MKPTANGCMSHLVDFNALSIHALTPSQEGCQTLLEGLCSLEEVMEGLGGNVDSHTLAQVQVLGHHQLPEIGDNIETYLQKVQECGAYTSRMWNWLIDLSRCIEHHVSNSRDYYKFHQDLGVCDKTFDNILDYLQHLQSLTGEDQLSNIAGNLKSTLTTLLTLQDLYDSLTTRSRSLRALDQRVRMTSPQSVTCLVDYTSPSISLKSGEKVLVSPNILKTELKSLRLKADDYWMVTKLPDFNQEANSTESDDNKWAAVPSLILSLCSIDQKSFDLTKELRTKLSSVWKHAVEVFRNSIVKILRHEIEIGLLKKSSTLISMVVCLDQVSMVPDLLSCGILEEDEKLIELVEYWRVRLETTEPTDDESTEDWTTLVKVLQLFKDLETYREFYNDSKPQESNAEKSVSENPYYVSKAYISKVSPKNDESVGDTVDPSENVGDTYTIEDPSTSTNIHSENATSQPIKPSQSSGIKKPTNQKSIKPPGQIGKSQKPELSKIDQSPAGQKSTSPAKKPGSQSNPKSQNTSKSPSTTKRANVEPSKDNKTPDNQPTDPLMIIHETGNCTVTTRTTRTATLYEILPNGERRIIDQTSTTSDVVSVQKVADLDVKAPPDVMTSSVTSSSRLPRLSSPSPNRPKSTELKSSKSPGPSDRKQPLTPTKSHLPLKSRPRSQDSKETAIHGSSTDASMSFSAHLDDNPSSQEPSITSTNNTVTESEVPSQTSQNDSPKTSNSSLRKPRLHFRSNENRGEAFIIHPVKGASTQRSSKDPSVNSTSSQPPSMLQDSLTDDPENNEVFIDVTSTGLDEANSPKSIDSIKNPSPVIEDLVTKDKASKPESEKSPFTDDQYVEVYSQSGEEIVPQPSISSKNNETNDQEDPNASEKYPDTSDLIDSVAAGRDQIECFSPNEPVNEEQLIPSIKPNVLSKPFDNEINRIGADGDRPMEGTIEDILKEAKEDGISSYPQETLGSGLSNPDDTDYNVTSLSFGQDPGDSSGDNLITEKDSLPRDSPEVTVESPLEIEQENKEIETPIKKSVPVGNRTKSPGKSPVRPGRGTPTKPLITKPSPDSNLQKDTAHKLSIDGSLDKPTVKKLSNASPSRSPVKRPGTNLDTKQIANGELKQTPQNNKDVIAKLPGNKKDDRPSVLKPLNEKPRKPITNNSTEKTGTKADDSNKTTPLIEKPLTSQTVNSKPITEKPVGGKPTNHKPDAVKPTNQKPDGGKLTNQKPDGSKPTNQKPVGGKSTNQKLDEGKPTNQKPDEVKPTNQKPVSSKPTNEKPAIGKTINTKPNETKPVIEKPVNRVPNAKPINRKPKSDVIQKTKPISHPIKQQTNKPVNESNILSSHVESNNEIEHPNDDEDQTLAQSSDKMDDVLSVNVLNSSEPDQLPYPEDLLVCDSYSEDKRYVIIGVKDPRRQNPISIFKAIEEGIVLPEEGIYQDPLTGDTVSIPIAMETGLIDAELMSTKLTQDFVQSYILGHTENRLFPEGEESNGEVIGVVDTAELTVHSLEEALQKGLVDPTVSVFNDMQRNQFIPIGRAVDSGCLVIGQPDDQLNLVFVTEVVTFDAEQRGMSLQEARNAGIINLRYNSYNDNTDDQSDTAGTKSMPLTAAACCGLISLSECSELAERDDFLVLRSSNKIDPSIDDIIQLSNQVPANCHVIDCLIKADCFDYLLFTPGSDEMLSVPSCLASGILTSLDPLVWSDPNGDLNQVTGESLLTACSSGMLPVEKAINILGAFQENDLQHKLPDFASYTKDASLISVPELQELVSENDEFDAKSCFLLSYPDCVITSVSQAIENSPNKQYRTEINADTLHERLTDLSNLGADGFQLKLRGIRCAPIDGVVHPDQTLELAVLNRLVSLDEAVYYPNARNPEGESMSINEAVQQGFIDPKIDEELDKMLSKIVQQSRDEINTNAGKDELLAHLEDGDIVALSELLSVSPVAFDFLQISFPLSASADQSHDDYEKNNVAVILPVSEALDRHWVDMKSQVVVSLGDASGADDSAAEGGDNSVSISLALANVGSSACPLYGLEFLHQADDMSKWLDTVGGMLGELGQLGSWEPEVMKERIDQLTDIQDLITQEADVISHLITDSSNVIDRLHDVGTELCDAQAKEVEKLAAELDTKFGNLCDQLSARIELMHTLEVQTVEFDASIEEIGESLHQLEEDVTAHNIPINDVIPTSSKPDHSIKVERPQLERSVSIEGVKHLEYLSAETDLNLESAKEIGNNLIDTIEKYDGLVKEFHTSLTAPAPLQSETEDSPLAAVSSTDQIKATMDGLQNQFDRIQVSIGQLQQGEAPKDSDNRDSDNVFTDHDSDYALKKKLSQDSSNANIKPPTSRKSTGNDDVRQTTSSNTAPRVVTNTSLGQERLSDCEARLNKVENQLKQITPPQSSKSSVTRGNDVMEKSFYNLPIDVIESKLGQLDDITDELTLLAVDLMSVKEAQNVAQVYKRLDPDSSDVLGNLSDSASQVLSQLRSRRNDLADKCDALKQAGGNVLSDFRGVFKCLESADAEVSRVAGVLERWDAGPDRVQLVYREKRALAAIESGLDWKRYRGGGSLFDVLEKKRDGIVERIGSLRQKMDDHLQHLEQARKMNEELQEAIDSQRRWMDESSKQLTTPTARRQSKPALNTSRTPSSSLIGSDRSQSALLGKLREERPKKQAVLDRINSLSRDILAVLKEDQAALSVDVPTIEESKGSTNNISTASGKDMIGSQSKKAPHSKEEENKMRQSVSGINRDWFQFWENVADISLKELMKTVAQCTMDTVSLEEALKLDATQADIPLDDKVKKLDGIMESCLSLTSRLSLLSPLVTSALADSSLPGPSPSITDLFARVEAVHEEAQVDRERLLNTVQPLLNDASNRCQQAEAFLNDVTRQVQTLPQTPSVSVPVIRDQIKAVKLLDAALEDDTTVSSLQDCVTALSHQLPPEQITLVTSDLATLTDRKDKLECSVREKLADLYSTLVDQTKQDDIMDCLDECLESVHDLDERSQDLPPLISGDRRESARLMAELDQREQMIAKLKAGAFVWSMPDIIDDSVASISLDVSEPSGATPRGQTVSISDPTSTRDHPPALQDSKALLSKMSTPLDASSPDRSLPAQGHDVTPLALLNDLEAHCGDLRSRLSTGPAQAVPSGSAGVEEVMGGVQSVEICITKVQEEMEGLGDSWPTHDVILDSIDTLKSMPWDELEDRVDKADDDLTSCAVKASSLFPEEAPASGQGVKAEVEWAVERVKGLVDDTREDQKSKREEMENALKLATQFEERIQKFKDWFPKWWERLDAIGPPKVNTRGIQLQIEELKVFKTSVFPQLVELEALRDDADELLKRGYLSNPQIITLPLEEVDSQWTKLVNAIADNENCIQKQLVQVGELDIALDEVSGVVQELECQLQNTKPLEDDLHSLQNAFQSLQMLSTGILSLAPTMVDLQAAIASVTSQGAVDHRKTSLLARFQEVDELVDEVKLLLDEKMCDVKSKIREMKLFYQEIEENITFMEQFRLSLAKLPHMGAKEATVKAAYEKYLKRFKALESRNTRINALLSRLPASTPALHHHRAALLSRLAHTTMARAKRQKATLERHAASVCRLASDMAALDQWLCMMEDQMMTKFNSASKITATCAGQIKQVCRFVEDTEAKKGHLDELCMTGTYLKYFGSKEEAAAINATLAYMQLRYKKLLRRAAERSRILEQAYREDKRFSDSWSDIMFWLDSIQERVLINRESTGKIKEQVERMKLLLVQLSAKYPHYYTTLRLGKNLSGRCLKNDPEREQLGEMIERMREKWNSIHTLGYTVKSEVDCRLLSSGRVEEAVQALLEWMDRAERISSPSRPSLGDLDSVELLMDEHKSMKLELQNYGNFLELLEKKGQECKDMNQDLLINVRERWPRICEIMTERDHLLQIAHDKAEAMRRLCSGLREWLIERDQEMAGKKAWSSQSSGVNQPNGNHGDKTSSHSNKLGGPSNEDEELVRHLHRQETVGQEIVVRAGQLSSLQRLAGDIIQGSSDPVGQHITRTLHHLEARWAQFVSMHAARTQYLTEALSRLHGNAAKVESTLQALSRVQQTLCGLEDRFSLLVTAAAPPPPPSAPSSQEIEEKNWKEEIEDVKLLIGQHKKTHDHLLIMGKTVEELVTEKSSRPPSRAGHLKPRSVPLPDGDKVVASRNTHLNSVYRQIWKQSVDQKQKLQELLERITELSNFKNFDLNEWRIRYLDWIRSRRLRLTDIFRHHENNSTNPGETRLSKEDFVEGLCRLRVPSSRVELGAVFDLFDKKGQGSMLYRDFIDAMKPDRKDSDTKKVDHKHPHQLTRNLPKHTKTSAPHEKVVKQCQRHHGDGSTSSGPTSRSNSISSPVPQSPTPKHRSTFALKKESSLLGSHTPRPPPTHTSRSGHTHCTDSYSPGSKKNYTVPSLPNPHATNQKQSHPQSKLYPKLTISTPKSINTPRQLINKTTLENRKYSPKSTVPRSPSQKEQPSTITNTKPKKLIPKYPARRAKSPSKPTEMSPKCVHKPRQPLSRHTYLKRKEATPLQRQTPAGSPRARVPMSPKLRSIVTETKPSPPSRQTSRSSSVTTPASPGRIGHEHCQGSSRHYSLPSSGSEKKSVVKLKSDNEMIHDAIEMEVSRCRCTSRFVMEKVAEGKYRCGDGRRLFLVRFLNSSVVVRVGGGWVTLAEFMITHDPCRAKTKAPTDGFSSSPGSNQARMAFKPRPKEGFGSSHSINSLTEDRCSSRGSSRSSKDGAK